eukprot:6203222-Pleurochrysis_carterae.AAC.1
MLGPSEVHGQAPPPRLAPRQLCHAKAASRLKQSRSAHVSTRKRQPMRSTLNQRHAPPPHLAPSELHAVDAALLPARTARATRKTRASRLAQHCPPRPRASPCKSYLKPRARAQGADATRGKRR